LLLALPLLAAVPARARRIGDITRLVGKYMKGKTDNLS
jgi:hypothetical protein